MIKKKRTCRPQGRMPSGSRRGESSLSGIALLLLSFPRLLPASRVLFFFFKQKTAYDLSECDWSSDVCSSDLYLRSQSKYHEQRSQDGERSWHGLRSYRSEERRVGKECRIGCRSRWSAYH